MSRMLLAAVLVIAASTARAADLPTGTWSVNVAGKTGKLVIKEVGADKKVKLTLFETDVVGGWDGETLTFIGPGLEAFEAYLVSEPVLKGERMKYTLTGLRMQVSFAQTDVPPPAKKTGWYAQIFVLPTPAGQIKVEVKGVLVCPADKPLSEAHVLVKQKNVFGTVEETRIYFYLSEGEWKGRRDDYQRLNGEAVTITGALGQIPPGSKTSIPEGAMYFQRGYEIKTAKETLK